MYGFRHGSRHERHARDLRAFLDNPYVSLVPVGADSAKGRARTDFANGVKASCLTLIPSETGSTDLTRSLPQHDLYRVT